MEIKVGDKVRVSKDAPKLYTNNWTVDWNNGESVVMLIDGDAAKIKQVDDNDEWFYLDIPLKYLVKVEDEAKEPKFKAGDKVITAERGKNMPMTIKCKTGKHYYALEEVDYEIHESYLEPYTEPTEEKKPKFQEGEIVRYRCDGNLYIVECKTGKYHYALRRADGDIMKHDVLESDLAPYTEPTAPTIKVGDVIDTPKGKGKVTMVADGYVLAQGDNGEWWQISIDKDKEFEDNIRNVLNGTDEFPMGGHIQTSIIQIGEMGWDAYTADLTHDLALKVANKYNNPKEAAEYAVSVAKTVVENLKKK